MIDRSRTEDWRLLCEQASKESDPQRLLDLLTRINRALEKSHRESQREHRAFAIDNVLLQSTRAPQTDSRFYSFPPQLSLARTTTMPNGHGAWQGVYSD